MKKLILLFTVALMMQSCSVTVEIPARNDDYSENGELVKIEDDMVNDKWKKKWE